MKYAFKPHRLLKNPHVQSVLASSGLRGFHAKRRFPELLAASRPLILECGQGVRLSGALARQPGASRGLVCMIHGWEGSIQSSYLLSTGGRLFEDGFDVFRINLRDHGDSHGLNEELFHSCRLDEVKGALQRVIEDVAPKNTVLGGFSLGGNFSLRIALAMPQQFQFVFAVCPPLVPKQSLAAIEQAPWFYQAYFLMKWRASLQIKQKHFSNRYDFQSWRGLNIRETTEALIGKYTDFPSVDDYLDGYAVGPDRLQSLTTPALIVAAKDDPVIPVADFFELKRHPNTRLEVLEHGGHCGFLQNLKFESFMEERLSRAIGEICP
jgi:uncharacterized protein